ncbi:O-antigen ligase family protein [Devosia sp. WQ 349]|uniref:O-antigen ligase family protein n=1 Tax=Devosia sp. WQ 349K1 TaxID=2800329 RepID=UPI001907EF54|nr:O-antigen ligase family protein [Devosia sp. WQ 349K1]MBK1794450.1 O-antigen ligase family protein [Devosia sp. WQ 349K1]
MKRLYFTVSTIENVCAGFIFLVASGAFQYLASTVGGEDSRQFSNPTFVEVLSYLTRFSVVIGVLVLARRVDENLLRRSWPIWLLMGFVAASYFWSVAPSATAEALFRMVPMLLVGIWVLSSKTSVVVKARLRLLALLILSANIIAVIAFTDMSFMQGRHEGAMRGAFRHKNELGVYSVFALSIFIFIPADKRHFHFLQIALSIVFLALTRSSTSYVCLVVVILTGGGIHLINKAVRGTFARYGVLLVGAAVALPLTIVASSLIEELLPYLGRDLSLSGRTKLWQIAAEAFQQRPLLGNGFRAFWFSSNPWTNDFAAQQIWKPSHFHNGYIASAVDGGLAQALILAFVIFYLLATSLGQAFRKEGSQYWPLVASIFLIVYNLSETGFPFDNAPFTVIALSVVAFSKLAAPAAVNGSSVQLGSAQRGSQIARSLS